MRPEIEDVLALSPLQEGLFALHRLAEGGLDLYSMQFVIDIDGPVDVGLLRRSANAMLVRYPNLRAVFWDRDVPRPVQIIPAAAELPWTERTALPTEFEAIAAAERRNPFDLSTGPLLRVLLIEVPGQRGRRMVFTAHHILVDGWALAVFCTEMLAVYRAGGSLDGLPPVRLYRDYIVWLAEQDRAGALADWRDHLRGVSGPLMLADGTVAVGDQVPEKTEVLLSAADTARLRQWAAGTGLTLSTAVLFAWAVVLSAITGRRDVVFGTIVSGRPEQLAGVDSMVGLFINIVPVAHQFSANESVITECRRLQRELSALRDRSYLSLAELQREHGQGALFDTLFVFENAPIDEAIQPVTEPDGTAFRPVQMESLTHYPLTVVAHLSGDQLLVVVEAIPAALPHLPADLGQRLLGVLRQLPAAADRTPRTLDVLTDAERARLPGYSAPGPGDGTVWEHFERQVRATPDALALTAGSGESYSYAQLHAAACRLAARLAADGAGPETVVALRLPRSTQAIVAILAVLATGAAYLPIDIALPPARITAMLSQADPLLTITETSHPDLPDSSGPAAVPPVNRHPGHAAYVIFTSGSTGEPKGVVGTNAALVGYFADHRDRVYRPAGARLGRPLRIAHAWSFSFDASWQPLVGLLDGHALHLFDADEMRDADRLVAGIAAHRIDMIDTTPSMLVQLAAAGLLEQSLSVLALGGEAIDSALWSRLRELGSAAVYNCYGPTETTVEAVVAPVAAYPAPTIGTPNAGTIGYVLDSMLRVVPDGAVGELYLSGAQLARGYAGRPGLTAACFVADPLRPGERMYRTGDLARRLPHGGYAYLGRADNQVKIRGYRVETGEIEAALRGLPGVTDAAVSVLRRAGSTTLVGFVAGDCEVTRPALAALLPQYMIPARVITVPQLPMNANGKLDGHALDRLAAEAVTSSTDSEPSTAIERTLCEVFAEQFNGAPPNIDDDLFTLGLDSIVAISVVHKARRRGLAVSPRMVFAAGTIRQLAADIELSAAPIAIENPEYGPVLPLPMVSWLQEYGNYRRFTHTLVLRPPPGIDRPGIEAVLQLLLDGHDTLRSVLGDTDDGPRLHTREPGVVRAADVLSCVTVSRESEFASALTAAARAADEDVDPSRGAMLRAVWLTGDEQALLISAHHLAVDVVSWHIIGGDIVAGKALPEFTSYRRFCELMWARAADPQLRDQLGHWLAQVTGPDPALGARRPDPTRDTWSTLRVTSVRTSVQTTRRVLAGLGSDRGMRAFLLATTAKTITDWRRLRGQDSTTGTLIALEGHGRADELLGSDTSNTVGWFTTAFPVRLPHDASVDSVAAGLAEIPNDGLDYGLLRYIERVSGLAVDPQIQFGYLGRIDTAATGEAWSLLTGRYLDALPIDPEPELPLRFALNISALLGSTEQGVQLITNLRWSSALFSGEEIDKLAELWESSINALAAEVTR